MITSFVAIVTLIVTCRYSDKNLKQSEQNLFLQSQQFLQNREDRKSDSITRVYERNTQNEEQKLLDSNRTKNFLYQDSINREQLKISRTAAIALSSQSKLLQVQIRSQRSNMITFPIGIDTVFLSKYKEPEPRILLKFINTGQRTAVMQRIVIICISADLKEIIAENNELANSEIPSGMGPNYEYVPTFKFPHDPKNFYLFTAIQYLDDIDSTKRTKADFYHYCSFNGKVLFGNTTTEENELITNLLESKHKSMHFK